jgi:AcrR family transcriptional regulator
MLEGEMDDAVARGGSVAQDVQVVQGASPRWQADARGRLALAALDLFEERGYDQTTVAEIAEQAGLTKQTSTPRSP